MRYKITQYPGYLGDKKELMYKAWDKKYKKWKLRWIFENQIVSFDEIFWKVYVAGYTNYFFSNHDEAKNLATKYSYTYDKDLITKEKAFDYKYLLNKKKSNNQFHHCALNFAIKYNLNLEFNGTKPLQVRGKDSGGYKWNPGFIKSTVKFTQKQIKGWWEPNSIEAYYQSHKVLLTIK